MHFLLVESDPQAARSLAAWLEDWDYSVTWLRDSEAARSHEPDRFSLVLVGIPPGAPEAQPVQASLQLIAHHRERGNVPIVAQCLANEPHVRLAALEAGADDVVDRDPWPRELRARLQARLRRPHLQRSETLHLGQLVLDPDRRSARVAGAAIAPTRVEFELLLALGQRCGQAVERRWLAENVLGDARDRAQRTLDVHVSRVRKKLGPCGSYLQTVWGIGYRLEPQATPEDGPPAARPSSRPGAAPAADGVPSA
ncbi:MAG: response regulator transcription factor [Planctomycetota bacterium]|jgi:two-component system response regulator MtrA